MALGESYGAGPAKRSRGINRKKINSSGSKRSLHVERDLISSASVETLKEVPSVENEINSINGRARISRAS